MAARLVLTTAYDDAFAPMGDLSARAIRLYADAHGYDVRIERDRLSDRPPPWNKVLLLHRLMAEGYDWVIWIDADALIVRQDVAIADCLPDTADLALANHKQVSITMPGVRVELDVPNTGVMFVRNSDWSRAYWTRIWEMTQYLEHAWWENAAVIDTLGYRYLLDRTQRNAPDPETLAHVHWLDWNWNSVPGECEGPDPIVRHYTRRSDFGGRLKEMVADYEAQPWLRAAQA